MKIKELKNGQLLEIIENSRSTDLFREAVKELLSRNDVSEKCLIGLATKYRLVVTGVRAQRALLTREKLSPETLKYLVLNGLTTSIILSANEKIKLCADFPELIIRDILEYCRNKSVAFSMIDIIAERKLFDAGTLRYIAKHSYFEESIIRLVGAIEDRKDVSINVLIYMACNGKTERVAMNAVTTLALVGEIDEDVFKDIAENGLSNSVKHTALQTLAYCHDTSESALMFVVEQSRNKMLTNYAKSKLATENASNEALAVAIMSIEKMVARKAQEILVKREDAPEETLVSIATTGANGKLARKAAVNIIDRSGRSFDSINSLRDIVTHGKNRAVSLLAFNAICLYKGFVSIQIFASIASNSKREEFSNKAIDILVKKKAPSLLFQVVKNARFDSIKERAAYLIADASNSEIQALMYVLEHFNDKEVIQKAQDTIVSSKTADNNSLSYVARNGYSNEIAIKAMKILSQRKNVGIEKFKQIAEVGKCEEVALIAVDSMLPFCDDDDLYLRSVTKNGKSEAVALKAAKAIVEGNGLSLATLRFIEMFGLTENVKKVAKDVLSTESWQFIINQK